MKRGAVFEDEEPEVSRNSQTAPLSTEVPSDQYLSPSHATSSESKYTLEQEQKEADGGPLEPLPGDLPAEPAPAETEAPHPHHSFMDPHYLLQRTAQMGGAVWTQVKETSTSLFGVKFVWIERPQGGSVCTFVVQDEIKLAAWFVITILGLVVAILAIINLMTGKISFEAITEKKHYVAIIISAAFSVGATYITRVQVKAHYANWTHPKAQIKIVRIVLMVPIYAWSAWIGLAVIELAPYVDFVRICYEAYVIYNFLLLLTKYLGGHVGVVAVLKEKPEQHVKWPQPFCCFPRAHLGSTFLWAIKYGTMQYVIITPLISFAAVILAMFGLYHDGVMDWHAGYVYVMIIQNVTQLTALYCLVWYYVIMKDDLKPFHPLAKFLVVKSVVFFTFWQGVAINVMVKIGWIEDESDLSAAEVQLGLQDFIICIEMFIAAAVHRYTFGHEDFANGTFQGMIDECRARAVRKQDEITKDDMAEVFYDLEIEHPEFEAPDADSIQIKGQQATPAPSTHLTVGDPSLIVPSRSGGFAVGGGDIGMTQMAAAPPAAKSTARSGAGGWKVM